MLVEVGESGMLVEGRMLVEVEKVEMLVEVVERQVGME